MTDTNCCSKCGRKLNGDNATGQCHPSRRSACLSRLVKNNQGLVYSVAQKFAGHRPLEDLMQEGYIGLLRAEQDYDPKRAAWSTYARYWIYAHIVRFSKKSQTVHVPPGGKSKKHLELEVLSLDAPRHHGDEAGTWLENLTSEYRPADELVHRQEVSQQVRDALRRIAARLKGMPKAIVEQRLMRADPVTLGEIAEQFGYSRERVRQVEVQTRRMLAKQLLPIHEEMTGA